MQKFYCSVYPSEFQDTTVEHNDRSGEDLTESVNIVLAVRSCNTLREPNSENASYEKLTDKEMEAFSGTVERVWHVADIASYYNPTSSSSDGIHCLLWPRRNTGKLMR